MDNGAGSYRRFLDGDDTGLEEIVKDYKDGLIFYLNGFVNNLSVAEELMEETFFKLITKKPKFTPKNTFKTWLYTVGRNVAIDYLRRNSKMADTSLDELETVLRDEWDLEQSYLAEENKISLHRAIKRLHPEYRQILWLVYFEDFSGKEVAGVMKKNSEQIKNLLYRAKKALKSELEKEGFVYEEL